MRRGLKALHSVPTTTVGIVCKGLTASKHYATGGFLYVKGLVFLPDKRQIACFEPKYFVECKYFQTEHNNYLIL